MSTEQTTVPTGAGASNTEAPVLNIPSDIYMQITNEEGKTNSVLASFDFFKQASILSQVKTNLNVLHKSLEKKSKIFIFGAGGTTSWFLPKLLKIYNDSFHKVPNLVYDLDIVLVDADQVRI